MELKVTPQIALSGNIILDVTVKDAPISYQSTSTTSEPRLEKREIATKLIIKNSNTVVLGDIPLLGWLFSSVSSKIFNKELLIFLTPKIVSPNNQHEPSANK